PPARSHSLVTQASCPSLTSMDRNAVRAATAVSRPSGIGVGVGVGAGCARNVRTPHQPPPRTRTITTSTPRILPRVESLISKRHLRLNKIGSPAWESRLNANSALTLWAFARGPPAPLAYEFN